MTWMEGVTGRELWLQLHSVATDAEEETLFDLAIRCGYLWHCDREDGGCGARNPSSSVQCEECGHARPAAAVEEEAPDE